MANEILKLTTEIITAHASLTELTPEQLVQEIKDVHSALAALESGEILGEAVSEAGKETAGVKKPSIPLRNIVTAKHVVCLECGKKLKTLRTHLRKAHGLAAKEYYQRFDLDPKKYPLVCKEYSTKRSEMAKARGFGKK
jgi:predicted transcriptional regulator